MPKDDRKILSAIRLPGTREGKKYTRGAVITDADELEAAGVDTARLAEIGAIEGTFKETKAAAKKSAK